VKNAGTCSDFQVYISTRASNLSAEFFRQYLSCKFMGKVSVVFAGNIPGHFEVEIKHSLAIGETGNAPGVAD
jgi:hypothetical protein